LQAAGLPDKKEDSDENLAGGKRVKSFKERGTLAMSHLSTEVISIRLDVCVYLTAKIKYVTYS
jgi:hypothetical protein